jgi:hypothetical protein
MPRNLKQNNVEAKLCVKQSVCFIVLFMACMLLRACRECSQKHKTFGFWFLDRSPSLTLKKRSRTKRKIETLPAVRDETLASFQRLWETQRKPNINGSTSPHLPLVVRNTNDGRCCSVYLGRPEINYGVQKLFIIMDYFLGDFIFCPSLLGTSMICPLLLCNIFFAPLYLVLQQFALSELFCFILRIWRKTLD